MTAGSGDCNAVNKHYDKGMVFDLIKRGVGELELIVLKYGNDILYISKERFRECFESYFGNIKSDKNAPFYIYIEGEEE